LKIVILNNHCHGMVRQFQESYFEGRYPSTLWGYSAPDFAGVGRSFGIPSRSIAREDEVSSAFEWLWESQEKPALLEVSIDTFANAYPKVKFGCGLDEMEP
jgi:acetolactate synthase-1/2/3 large subunit